MGNNDNPILGKYKRESSDSANRERMYPIYQKNRGMYPLPFSEYEIHHKDFNKNNNDINNLILLTPAEHDTIHLKKIQKIQSQKKEAEMIEQVRIESEREERERRKEMKENEREKKRLENQKRESKRRRIRSYEDEKRLMMEREAIRAHHEKEEEKRMGEKQKEWEKNLKGRKKRIFKNVIEGLIIILFIILLIGLFFYLNKYTNNSTTVPTDLEGNPITLSSQEAITLCEDGCKDEGGFSNSYYNFPTELGCTCKKTASNGENIIKIFSKTKQKWIN
jgi:hypothetical protein